jgi:hypothetical protein
MARLVPPKLGAKRVRHFSAFRFSPPRLAFPASRFAYHWNALRKPVALSSVPKGIEIEGDRPIPTIASRLL